jgi:hypothetical protein
LLCGLASAVTVFFAFTMFLLGVDFAVTVMEQKEKEDGGSN